MDYVRLCVIKPQEQLKLVSNLQWFQRVKDDNLSNQMYKFKAKFSQTWFYNKLVDSSLTEEV